MEKYKIATGTSRTARQWTNTEMTWEELSGRCARTARTGETAAEYKAMTREQQGARKDVGGFVGGYLRDGVRKAASVTLRSVLTLDLDFAEAGSWDRFCGAWPGVAALCYSTHSHTPQKPRLRLVVPLSRDLGPEEYEPVARRVAERVGMDAFDDTTYQPARLFYWPSTPRDGEFYYREQAGSPLDADAVLATYTDWRDASAWPTSSRQARVVRRMRDKAGDPIQKKGLVGAFCRTYSIEEAIEAYLGDVYEPTRKAGRYTYTAGHVSGGLVCYNGKFAYANNATDPAAGRLCNAFDLVRIHRCGGADEPDDRPMGERQSWKRMEELAMNDRKVKAESAFARFKDVREEFCGIDDDEIDGRAPAWMEELDTRRNGDLLPTIANLELILDNDSRLKGKIWYNRFTGEICVEGDMPWPRQGEQWTDADDAQLWGMTEKVYGISHQAKLAAAVSNVAQRHGRHPVLDYFDSLPAWDGHPRLERLIIRAVGSPDTELTRTVTRMHFAAAVRRILEPGCKYDYCLTLVGPEGTGKSSLIKAMGEPWFTDSLNTLDSKSAVEQLQHAWLCELAEFAAMKKVEVEQVKAFISRTDDMMRPAYGRRVVSRPRHIVFFGTSNDPKLLRGEFGNRRFLIVPIDPSLRRAPSVAESMRQVAEARDQLWAEALHYARDENFNLYLDERLEARARKLQQEYNAGSDDPMREDLRVFCDTLVPDDWEERSFESRRSWWTDDTMLKAVGTVRRDVVSSREFLMEYYGWRRDNDRMRQKTYEVNRIFKEWGWKEVTTSRHSEKAYGVRLRSYQRPENEGENDC